MGHIVQLGRAPRPVLVKFTYTDGSVSAWYAVETEEFDAPDGIVAVEIVQAPVYPMDYPAGNEPGWLVEGPLEELAQPGGGTVTRPAIRTREHFLSRGARPGR